MVAAGVGTVAADAVLVTMADLVHLVMAIGFRAMVAFGQTQRRRQQRHRITLANRRAGHRSAFRIIQVSIIDKPVRLLQVFFQELLDRYHVKILIKTLCMN